MEEYDELVAPYARHEIAGTNRTGQLLSRGHDQPIASGVPQFAISLLEPVQIEIENASLTGATLFPREGTIQCAE